MVMPIILATQEAGIRKIMVQSQPQANTLKSYLKNTQHKTELKAWLKC
jgi:hypothetical protein